MKNAILIVGAVFGCALGGSIGACSSATTGGVGGGTTTASTTSSTSTTSTTSTSTTSSTSSTSGGGAGGGTATTSSTSTSSSSGECGKITTLHPPKLDAGPGTIYCPFSATVDGGPESYCTPGTEHCCVTPESANTPSTCEPFSPDGGGTACASGDTDFQCEDPVTDCTTDKPVCCAPGATLVLGTPAGVCGNYASEMKNSYCTTAALCPTTGNIVLCTATSECPTGTTCTPFEKAGNDIGGCM